MITVITGLNASGKTVYLNKLYQRYDEVGKEVITNLEEVTWEKELVYSGISKERFKLLTDEDIIDLIFDYHVPKIMLDRIWIDTPDKIFTANFMDMITLMTRNGSILLLDEPDIGLTGMEINSIRKILEIYNSTFEEIFVVTHHPWLFPIADKFLWVSKDGTVHEVSGRDVYGAIGTV